MQVNTKNGLSSSNASDLRSIEQTCNQIGPAADAFAKATADAAPAAGPAGGTRSRRRRPDRRRRQRRPHRRLRQRPADRTRPLTGGWPRPPFRSGPSARHPRAWGLHRAGPCRPGRAAVPGPRYPRDRPSGTDDGVPSPARADTARLRCRPDPGSDRSGALRCPVPSDRRVPGGTAAGGGLTRVPMSRVVRFHETGGPEVLRVEEADVPPPGSGEVLAVREGDRLNRAE